MKRILNTFAASLALTASMTAAPFNPAAIPADAAWYGHINVAALRTSELGRGIIGSLNDTQQAKLRFFQRMFGFSLVNDVNSVTLFGTEEKDVGLLMIEAKFDRTALLDMIRVSEKYKETEFQGQPIYEWYDQDKDRMTWGAFFGSDHVLISDRKEMVTRALATLNDKRDSLADKPDGLLAGQSTNSALVIGAANLADIEANPDAAFLQKVEKGFLKINDDAQELTAFLALEAQTREQAVNIQKLLTGLVALVALNAEENPLAAQLASDAICRVDGKRVEVDMSMPVTLAVELFQKRMAEK